MGKRKTTPAMARQNSDFVTSTPVLKNNGRKAATIKPQTRKTTGKAHPLVTSSNEEKVAREWEEQRHDVVRRKSYLDALLTKSLNIGKNGGGDSSNNNNYSKRRNSDSTGKTANSASITTDRSKKKNKNKTGINNNDISTNVS